MCARSVCQCVPGLALRLGPGSSVLQAMLSQHSVQTEPPHGNWQAAEPSSCCRFFAAPLVLLCSVQPAAPHGTAQAAAPALYQAGLCASEDVYHLPPLLRDLTEMSKPAPSAPLLSESLFFTVVNPYPYRPHQSPEHSKTFSRWIACIVGADRLRAFYHTPKVRPASYVTLSPSRRLAV